MWIWFNFLIYLFMNNFSNLRDPTIPFVFYPIHSRGIHTSLMFVFYPIHSRSYQFPVLYTLKGKVIHLRVIHTEHSWSKGRRSRPAEITPTNWQAFILLTKVFNISSHFIMFWAQVPKIWSPVQDLNIVEAAPNHHHLSPKRKKKNKKTPPSSSLIDIKGFYSNFTTILHVQVYERW